MIDYSDLAELLSKLPEGASIAFLIDGNEEVLNKFLTVLEEEMEHVEDITDEDTNDEQVPVPSKYLYLAMTATEMKTVDAELERLGITKQAYGSPLENLRHLLALTLTSSPE